MNLISEAASWYDTRIREGKYSVIQINKAKESTDYDNAVTFDCTVHFSSDEPTDYDRRLIVVFGNRLLNMSDKSERRWGKFTEFYEDFFESYKKKLSVSEFLTKFNDEIMVKTRAEQWRTMPVPKDVTKFNKFYKPPPPATPSAVPTTSRLRIDDDDDDFVNPFSKKSTKIEDTWPSNDNSKPNRFDFSFGPTPSTPSAPSGFSAMKAPETKETSKEIRQIEEFNLLLKEKKKAESLDDDFQPKSQQQGGTGSIVAFNCDVIENWTDKITINLPPAKFNVADDFTCIPILYHTVINTDVDPITRYKRLSDDIRIILLIPGLTVYFNPNDLREIEIEIGPQFIGKSQSPNIASQVPLQFKIINFVNYYGSISSIFIPKFYCKNPMLLPMSSKTLPAQFCELKDRLQAMNSNDIQHFNMSDKRFIKCLQLLTVYLISLNFMRNDKEFINSNACYNIMQVFINLGNLNLDVTNFIENYQLLDFAAILLNSNYQLNNRNNEQIARVVDTAKQFYSRFNINSNILKQFMNV